MIDYRQCFNDLLRLLLCMPPSRRAAVYAFYLEHTFGITPPEPAAPLTTPETTRYASTVEDGLMALAELSIVVDENSSINDLEDTEEAQDMPGPDFLSPLDDISSSSALSYISVGSSVLTPVSFSSTSLSSASSSAPRSASAALAAPPAPAAVRPGHPPTAMATERSNAATVVASAALSWAYCVWPRNMLN